MRKIALLCLAMCPVASAVASAAENAEPHPVLSSNGSWVPIMLMIIGLFFFLAAAVIGPIVRANMPEEVPPSSHDEPPGSSHHHGKSGTINPAPEDEAHHH